MLRAPEEVRARLLDWYRAHRRDLPWRARRDPYAIWVSEVMLQQTRVDTVIPYYEAFLRRWPTVSALAAADPDDVRAAWSGLGYYRRARLMMDAARVIHEEHGGAFPRTAERLVALPGFGRYTAGAVASIAFDEPVAAVDGNVARVLARLDGIEGDVTRGPAAARVWALAETLAIGETPGEYTQAMIELGALVCAARRPKCLLCPVSDACVARADGTTDRIPAPRKRPERRSISLTAALWVSRGRILLTKMPEDGLFAGLWLPPTFEGALEPEGLADLARTAHGWRVDDGRIKGSLTHVLTHRDLHIRVVRLSGPVPRARAPMRWVGLDGLTALGVPSVTVKTLRVGLEPAEIEAVPLPGRRRSRPS